MPAPNVAAIGRSTAISSGGIGAAPISGDINYIPVAETPGVQTFPPPVRDWWDCDEWGRIYEGSCIRR